MQLVKVIIGAIDSNNYYERICCWINFDHYRSQRYSWM